MPWPFCRGLFGGRLLRRRLLGWGLLRRARAALLGRRRLSGAGVLVIVVIVAGVGVSPTVLHIRPQGGEQVGDLVVTVVVGVVLTLLDRERLSPGRLGFEELLELILVVVLVLLRLEIRRDRLNEWRIGPVGTPSPAIRYFD
ncbi:hypothetical protein, partial [Dietzia massiliensis]|uniref:hypothetical protein n=1 Tax=Dietzia massiliensis TaxID=2697499 RepID=UPI001BCD3DF6